MKTHLINFVLIIIFSLIMIITSYKKSGGDIFAQLMIGSFAILQIIIVLITRIFIKYNYLKTILWIVLGSIVSVGLFFIANMLATK
jgi:heme/copper-type cytochrome/quinol oxidase subunit 4